MQQELGFQEIERRVLAGRTIIADAARLVVEIYERGIETSLKQTERDKPTFLTQADKGAEALIVKRWLTEFEGDGFIGEEDGAKGRFTGSRISVIADPIDGTAVFSRGIMTYALALGICVDRVPVAAVIHTQGKTYSANAYQGTKAFNVEGHSVERMLDPVSPMRWIIASEMFNLLADGPLLMKKLWDAAGVHSNFASAIGTGVMVARGQLQAYVNPGVCLWDVAPLVPFAAATGLKLTRWDGSDPFPAMYDRVLTDPEKYAKGPQCFDMLMAAPAVHEALLPLVRPYAREREKALYGG